MDIFLQFFYVLCPYDFITTIHHWAKLILAISYKNQTFRLSLIDANKLRLFFTYANNSDEPSQLPTNLTNPHGDYPSQLLTNPVDPHGCQQIQQTSQFPKKNP
jgi:hypothetical protein